MANSFCTECGKALSPGKNFCGGCGASVNAGAGTSAPAQQPVYAQQPQNAPVMSEKQTEHMQQSPQQPTLPAQPQQQVGYAPTVPVNKKIKPPLIIGGIVGVGVIALAMVLIFTNVFGLFGKSSGGGLNENLKSDGTESGSTYEIFGDGVLIKTPQRLKASASPDDGISAAALVGPWKGYRNSVTTEYGFTDDGYFYKNTTITHAHLNSTYNSGYYSGDYYYYGYWTYNTTYTYTYLDTVIGEYRVKGGILELFHIFTTERTIFDDNWFYGKTRSVDIGQLQARANSARYNDDILMEFEFINSARIRTRTESEDMDLFWDIENDPHNVPAPKHQIPPVDWPAKALSPDMPLFNTKGRIREASLSYSGEDKNINAEYKTVNVVIDKTNALPEINAYGGSLKNSGWWVEDYELNGEDSYLSYESRKGMFKISVSNGRGSGTSADTIVIESNKYPEGKWPAAWSAAGLAQPDKSVIVGDFIPEKDENNKNIYETVIFDKVDENGIAYYKNKLTDAGFKKPQYSSDDWDMMQYIRIDGDLYLVRVQLSKRMDSLSAFTYDLSYIEDGIWPESWKNSGLPTPDGYDTIAGAIDKDNWDEHMAGYDSEYVYAKYLGLDEKGIIAYKSKLKSVGFIPVKDWDGNDTDELYNFLRIEGKMMRVEINVMDNEDITEIRYMFDCYKDGEWPDNWLSGGLPAPDKYETIIDAIDLERWNEDITSEWGGSSYVYIKYLGMTAADVSNYIFKLKNVGFKPVKDWDGNDTDELYNYLRIDGKLYRVAVERRDNYELTEFVYDFQYYEDGEWPSPWTNAGIPAPSFTAMPGKIDMAEFNENLNGWGSCSVNVKLLGANLSDYAAALKKSGFTEPEYSWTDTWELSKRIQINGQWVDVTIEDKNNKEIPEIYIYFRSE